MSINTKKGSLTVEAAILLPVFIMAILTFGYLIRVVCAEENIMHAMADEGRRLSVQSYNIKIAPLFGTILQKRLTEEHQHVEDFEIETFRYLFQAGGKEDLIAIRVDGFMKIKLPMVLHGGVDISETLLLRGFTGREGVPEEINYDQMEEKQESRQVWVFPVAGERYHEQNCGYIEVAAKQTTLDRKIRNQYNPCKHCKPGELSNGSVIYYFDYSGKVYHQGNCYIVDRYVIFMEEKDAVQKGYTPCGKCM